MKYCWRTLTSILFLLSATPVFSQAPENMVYNPSFEEHRDCPQHIEALGVMQEVDAWWQPTAGSSDYFNSCGGRECSVPLNKLGSQSARSGEAYCGIYCSRDQYREYLQTRLKTPLIAGKRYRISFWVSLSEKSPHAATTLGALFTKECIEDSTLGIVMKREVIDMGDQGSQSIAVYFEPQVVNSRERPLTDTKEWMEVSGEFTAEGGEEFLTIGNFFPFNKSRIVPTRDGQTPLHGAYYYVDDVSVTCIEQEPVEPEVSVEVPEVGEVILLENLYFAFDKSEVLQQSYNELVKLKELLERNLGMTIELRGHTDNLGTVEHNQRLSESRAKAVVDHLVSMGIDKSRLSWKGFGKSEPVADNSTAAGRQKNRRVEYKVLSR
ncbi:MAG: OmpA family protein [Bacteroidales bacterium]|nr:OmpA family protein [Bacteroidales bacterium]